MRDGTYSMWAETPCIRIGLQISLRSKQRTRTALSRKKHPFSNGKRIKLQFESTEEGKE